MSEEHPSLKEAGSCQIGGSEPTKLGIEKDGLGEVVGHMSCHRVGLDKTQEDVKIVYNGRFLRKMIENKTSRIVHC